MNENLFEIWRKISPISLDIPHTYNKYGRQASKSNVQQCEEVEIVEHKQETNESNEQNKWFESLSNNVQRNG